MNIPTAEELRKEIEEERIADYDDIVEGAIITAKDKRNYQTDVMLPYYPTKQFDELKSKGYTVSIEDVSKKFSRYKSPSGFLYNLSISWK